MPVWFYHRRDSNDYTCLLHTVSCLCEGISLCISDYESKHQWVLSFQYQPIFHLTCLADKDFHCHYLLQLNLLFQQVSPVIAIYQKTFDLPLILCLILPPFHQQIILYSPYSNVNYIKNKAKIIQIIILSKDQLNLNMVKLNTILTYIYVNS